MFGPKVHIYTVHLNPSDPAPHENPVFVEESFRWMAFFFTGFWALYHRLWLTGIALLCTHAILLSMVFSDNLHILTMRVIDIGLRALVGFCAADWQRAALKRQGYITADIVTQLNALIPSASTTPPASWQPGAASQANAPAGR